MGVRTASADRFTPIHIIHPISGDPPCSTHRYNMTPRGGIIIITGAPPTLIVYYVPAPTAHISTPYCISIQPPSGIYPYLSPYSQPLVVVIIVIVVVIVIIVGVMVVINIVVVIVVILSVQQRSEISIGERKGVAAMHIRPIIIVVVVAVVVVAVVVVAGPGVFAAGPGASP